MDRLAVLLFNVFMPGTLQAITLATTTGCGLVSGVFFAFSTFVMPALDRLPAQQGVAAMQSINRTAVTPAFMTLLFGTSLACVGLAGWAALSMSQPSAPWLLAGGALYLASVILVTIAANVPLNDTLATVHPDAAGIADRWSDYATSWTAWNHARAAGALGAAVLLIVGLILR